MGKGGQGKARERGMTGFTGEGESKSRYQLVKTKRRDP